MNLDKPFVVAAAVLHISEPPSLTLSARLYSVNAVDDEQARTLASIEVMKEFSMIQDLAYQIAEVSSNYPLPAKFKNDQT